MERAAGYVTLYAAVDGAREADVAGELLRGCTEVKGQICRCSIQLLVISSVIRLRNVLQLIPF